jgi:polyisoprenoid-binding protein YceI
MTRSRKTLIVLASTVAALALAAFGAWWFLLRSNAPAPVSLDDAVESLSTTTTAAATTTGAEAPSSTTTVPRDGLPGTWVVDTGSFAGYRVQEELANVGFTTAAGRSEQVTGSLVITDDTVTAVDTVTLVEVVVDMTALRSDADRRDRAIETQGLETRDFPIATFTLSEAITIPAGADAGTAFTIPATGDLTIHGVTHRVTIDLEAQFVDDHIVVVGSTPVLFADYGIDEPEAIVVLSVDDDGIMEFQLIFARA